MADFEAFARSNYFLVKDEATFRAWVATTELGIFEGAEGRLALHAMHADHGTWPSSAYDDETDEHVEFDIADALKPHLADGEVCILVEVGAEKMRYLGGWAIAFDNTDRPSVQVNLDDIYEKAKQAFGVDCTTASY